MKPERVQKILSLSGISSRRHADILVKEGKVTINGKVASPGDKADPEKDAIKVNGKLLIFKKQKMTYILFNKPSGILSSTDKIRNKNSMEPYFRKLKLRLIPAGKLDYNSEGLIFLTNDGNFSHKLSHTHTIPRVHVVKVKGHHTEKRLKDIKSGTYIYGKKVQPESVRIIETLNKKTKIEIVLCWGGTYPLKELLESRGFVIEKIIRTQIGPFSIEKIPRGGFKVLKESQIEALFNSQA